MPDMTKKQKRHLRDLAERCYEIEMSEALEDLNKYFKKWKNNEITVWDLNEKIHQHHDGTARDLYKFYGLLRNLRAAVAHGVSKGLIKIEDVNENCRSLLNNLIEFYDNE